MKYAIKPTPKSFARTHGGRIKKFDSRADAAAYIELRRSHKPDGIWSIIPATSARTTHNL